MATTSPLAEPLVPIQVRPGERSGSPEAALEASITTAEPEWLAFTSLTTGPRYLGPAAGFGEQGERIGRTRLWASAFPIANRGWNWEINAHWWRRLADAARSAEPIVIPPRAEATRAHNRAFSEIAK